MICRIFFIYIFALFIISNSTGLIFADDFTGYNILDLIEKNIIIVNSVIADGGLKKAHKEASQGHETFLVKLTNKSKEKLQIVIPCGLVFTPEEKKFQKMIVVKSSNYTLLPLDTFDINLYVACIDMLNDQPDKGDKYSVGYMHNGKLRNFIDCLCGIKNVEKDPMGAQFAIWNISSNVAYSANVMKKEELEKTIKMMKSYGNIKIPDQLINSLEYYKNAERLLERCKIDKARDKEL